MGRYKCGVGRYKCGAGKFRAVQEGASVVKDDRYSFMTDKQNSSLSRMVLAMCAFTCRDEQYFVVLTLPVERCTQQRYGCPHFVHIGMYRS